MADRQRLLVVDDDLELRRLLADFLGRHQFNVTTAANGVEMFAAFKAEQFALLILDVMMPGDDGLTLCRKVRAVSNIPILLLTAVSEEADKIIGLEMGADDYVTKPFNPRELLARIKAIMRRRAGHEAITAHVAPQYHFADWVLDTGPRTLLSTAGVEVILSAGEYDLLLALVERAQRVLSRDQLLEITKNREAGPFDRSVDIQISRIRQKIEDDPKAPQLIKTVRGGGYMLATTVTRAS